MVNIKDFQMTGKEMKRYTRFAATAAVLLYLGALVFGVGIASAEVGDITIVSYTIKEYASLNGYTCDALGTPIFTTIYWDSIDYNRIEDFRLSGSQVDFSAPAGSSRFTITAGGSGGGYSYFLQEYDRIYWIFDADNIYTSSPLTVSYTNYSMFSFVSFAGNSCLWGGTPLIDTPVAFPSTHKPVWNGGYWVTQMSSETTDTYVVDYFSVSGVQYFRLNLNKTTSLGSKYFINNETGSYGSESSFNSNDIVNYVAAYTAGLWLNGTFAVGAYTNKLINSTGVVGSYGVPAESENDPVVVGTNGYGIRAYPSTVYRDQNVNVSWKRTSDPCFGCIDYITYMRPMSMGTTYMGNMWMTDTLEVYYTFMLTSSPPSQGSIIINAETPGLYYVGFASCIAGACYGNYTKAWDSFTVVSETPSYVVAPSSVSVGKLFDVEYKRGWTVTNGTTAWLRARHFDSNNNAWEATYQPYAAIGGQGVKTTTQIIVTKPGKWSISLCDVILGCKASTETTAGYNTSLPPDAPTILTSNITLDSAIYSYGETMIARTRVDNINWSGKEVIIEYYDTDEGLTQTQIHVQAQSQTVPIYISDLTFSGSGAAQMRLSAINDTGSYVLATADFILSNVDSEGYGLSLSGKYNCTKDTVQIKVIAPEGDKVNLSISADDAKYNKEYGINGSRTVPYTFRVAGTHYITLRKDGEARRNIIVKINACDVGAGAGGAGGVGGAGTTTGIMSLMGSSLFVALIILIALMVTGFTMGGAVGGIAGIGAAIPLLAFGGLIPVWVAFLEGGVVFVCVALLVSSQIVKQG